MGIAEIIPGVSGGTIAFLLGIYEKFILSIKSINLTFLKNMLTFKFKDAFQVVEWKFLLVLGVGMVLAILSVSHLIEYLLQHKTEYIYGFFFGLILATGPIIARVIQKWNWHQFILIFISFIVTYHVVMLVPLETAHSKIILFFSGAIAISAMILPGISGSFILLVLGQYNYVLEAVNNRDLLTLLVFVSGITVGILSFVRVLSWLFKKHHDETLTVLTGVVLGSLNKIWPWKQTIRSMIDRHGELVPVEQVNVHPEFNASFWGVVLCMLVGFILAVVLNKSEKKMVDLEAKL